MDILIRNRNMPPPIWICTWLCENKHRTIYVICKMVIVIFQIAAISLNAQLYSNSFKDKWFSVSIASLVVSFTGVLLHTTILKQRKTMKLFLEVFIFIYFFFTALLNIILTFRDKSLMKPEAAATFYKQNIQIYVSSAVITLLACALQAVAVYALNMYQDYVPPFITGPALLVTSDNVEQIRNKMYIYSPGDYSSEEGDYKPGPSGISKNKNKKKGSYISINGSKTCSCPSENGSKTCSCSSESSRKAVSLPSERESSSSSPIIEKDNSDSPCTEQDDNIDSNPTENTDLLSTEPEIDDNSDSFPTEPKSGNIEAQTTEQKSDNTESILSEEKREELKLPFTIRDRGSAEYFPLEEDCENTESHPLKKDGEIGESSI